MGNVMFWRVLVLVVTINSATLGFVQMHMMNRMRNTLASQTSLIKRQDDAIKIQQQRLERCGEVKEVGF